MIKICLTTSVVALAAGAMTGLTNSAAAQTRAASASACPASYEPWNGICFNNADGDIVLARAQVASAMLKDPSCPLGYEIMFETLCFSTATGDVEFAEVTPAATLRAATK